MTWAFFISDGTRDPRGRLIPSLMAVILPLGESIMKIALHSVSYAGVWPGQSRLSLDDFLNKARHLGFDAVMLMAKRPHLSVLDYDTSARHRLRERLEELQLSVACLAGYTDYCMGVDRPDIPARNADTLCP